MKQLPFDLVNLPVDAGAAFWDLSVGVESSTQLLLLLKYLINFTALNVCTTYNKYSSHFSSLMRIFLQGRLQSVMWNLKNILVKCLRGIYDIFLYILLYLDHVMSSSNPEGSFSTVCLHVHLNLACSGNRTNGSVEVRVESQFSCNSENLIIKLSVLDATTLDGDMHPFVLIFSCWTRVTQMVNKC